MTIIKSGCKTSLQTEQANRLGYPFPYLQIGKKQEKAKALCNYGLENVGGDISKTFRLLLNTIMALFNVSMIK